MSSRIEIQLVSGVSIRLCALSQHYTYAGLIEGFPIRRLNKSLVADALKDARKRLWCDETPYLIPPVEASLGHPKQDWVRPQDEFEPMRIPGVTCLATFESGSPARDPDADLSSLNVVWFQEELAMPIAPEILQAIRDIDWRAHATDGWY